MGIYHTVVFAFLVKLTVEFVFYGDEAVVKGVYLIENKETAYSFIE
jgi:hypothetical protein